MMARRLFWCRIGFRFGPFCSAPFWLLFHAAWIPAMLLLAGQIVLSILIYGHGLGVVGLGIAWLVGLHAQDLRSWSLRRRGWRLAAIVTARARDEAYARLLANHDDLRAAAAG